MLTISPLERRLLVAIGKAKFFRGEEALCSRFGRPSGVGREGVEDALYALVRRGLLDWFEDPAGDHLPLRYRVTPTGASLLGDPAEWPEELRVREMPEVRA